MAEVDASEIAAPAVYSEQNSGHGGFFIGSVGGSTDVGAPQITNLVPAAGTSISRTQTITFSVVDPELTSVVTVSIGVRYPDNTAEWIYNGTSFFSPFDASSTVTPRGDGGFDFSITRTGGWPNVPTFHVIPVDAEGNV